MNLGVDSPREPFPVTERQDSYAICVSIVYTCTATFIPFTGPEELKDFCQWGNNVLDQDKYRPISRTGYGKGRQQSSWNSTSCL